MPGSRMGRLVRNVPVDNNKISLSGSWKKQRRLVKNRRQAEYLPRQRLPLACRASLPDDWRKLQRRSFRTTPFPVGGMIVR